MDSFKMHIVQKRPCFLQCARFQHRAGTAKEKCRAHCQNRHSQAQCFLPCRAARHKNCNDDRQQEQGHAVFRGNGKACKQSGEK